MYKYFLLILIVISCKENNLIKNSSKNQYEIDYKSFSGQKNINIDSLYQKVIKAKEDTIKINNLISIFKLSIKNRPLRDDVLDQALTISKAINYQTGIANCLSRKGVNARYIHQYIQSLKLHKEAVPYYDNSWDIRLELKT